MTTPAITSTGVEETVPAVARGVADEALPVQKASWLTMALGVLGLVVLCPLIQWLELGTEGKNSLTSGAVPPMPVLILSGLVMSAGLAWTIRKVQPRASFLLLYAMFMVGSTICSSGLVRPIFGSMTSIMDELLVVGVTTVRPGYDAQDPRVFPKIDRALLPDEADGKARTAAYAPLHQYSGGLKREPDEGVPRAAHGLRRFDTSDVVETANGQVVRTLNDLSPAQLAALQKELEAKGSPNKITRVSKGWWETTRIKVDFWWHERFLHDFFGVKGPIQSAREAEAARKAAEAGAAPPETKPVNSIQWKYWIWPMVNWGVFYLLVIAFMFALAEVLRRIWLRIENLSMPLAEVPSGILGLMAGEPGARKGSRLPTLIGMGIGAAWVSFFALGHFRVGAFVGITDVYQSIDLTPAFKDPPLNAVGTLKLYFSPLLIALGCLVSLEISRSIWSISAGLFFGLIVLAALGISGSTTPGPTQILRFSYANFPYWDDQSAGAAIILSVWLLWAARWRLWEILSALWTPVDAAKVGDYFIHPKVLPLVLIGLIVAMPAYAWWMGLTSITFIVIVFGLFLLFTIAAARMRAETGFPISPGIPSMTRYSLMFGGSAVWGEKAGMIGNHFFPIGTSMVASLLPSTLEIISVAQRQKVTLRRMAIGMLIAAGVALAVSMPMLAFWQYSQKINGPTEGLNLGGGKDAMYTYFRNYAGHFEWVRITAMGVGGGIMAVLLFARSRVLGFPLHPIGYLVAVQMSNGYYATNINNVNLIWGPMLLAWLLKRSVFKIGGAELFARMLPVFRGVIIGHFLAIAGWAVARGVVPALYETENVKLFFTW